MKNKFILLFLAAFFLSAKSNAVLKSPFEVTWDNKPLSIDAGGGFDLALTIEVPEGHYIYEDETDVEFLSLEGLVIRDIRYPKSVKYTDPYLNKETNIYRGDVKIGISGVVPPDASAGERELTTRVRFRGCSSTLCFRPEEKDVSFFIVVKSSIPERQPAIKAKEPSAGIVTLPPESGFSGLFRTQNFTELLDRGLVFAILIVFLAGILTSLTPCVWPVIPMVLLYVGVHPHKRLRENFTLSATLISGLILVYAVLGTLAVAFGKNFGFLFQNRFFLSAVVIFFLAMSLSMFGVFDIRLPRKWHNYINQLGGRGLGGAFLAGMGMGLVASPCAGPVLMALLGYVALQRDYSLGFLFLVVYGIGMGLLTIVLGTCYGELAGKLKSGPWMVWMKRLLGIVLLFPAVFYMGSLFHWSPALILTHDKPAIEWLSDESQALKIAQITNRPVMIEFGADWCPPCRVLETKFFTQPKIVELSYNLVPLHVDATVETKEVSRLIDKYHVIGWPTVIFLDQNGVPFDDLRVNSFDTYATELGMRAAISRALSQPKGRALSQPKGRALKGD